VTGYDVEELVDAAMGAKPMPTAPTYFDAMGAPLTRIVPLALAIANAVQAAQQAAAALQAGQQPGASQPAAAIAAAGANTHAQTNGSSGSPTRILVLHNMVTDEDLATDEDYNGLLEEVREECAKYGQLLSMHIPRMNQPGKGKIFLEYSTVTDAQAASEELSGRQFGDSYVSTSYHSEDDFRNKKF
jgi:splicing factor U2AF subunit